jgi:predicted Zn-dependent protease
LTAPAGWKIQNSKEAITLVNAEGAAGLVVKLVPAKAGSSHAEIVRNVLAPISGRVEPLTLNGLSATHVVGVRSDQQGQPQSFEATIVSGPGAQNYLLGYVSKDAQALRRAAPSRSTLKASGIPS